MLFCIVFLHHYDNFTLLCKPTLRLNWHSILLLELLLLHEELVDSPGLLFFELLLFFLLADVVLEVIKLLLHGPLAALVLQNGLRHRLNRRVSDGDQHWLLN